MLSGVRAQIALKIFGEDLDSLRTTAEQLRQRLALIPGLTDLQVEKQVLIPQLEIRVDYRRAGLDGVQPAAVIDQISRLSNGRVISRVVDGYRRFDVTMRLPDRLRTTQKLGDLLIGDAGWMDTGAADRRHPGDRWPEPDSSAKTGGGGSWCSPIPTDAPTWPKS